MKQAMPGYLWVTSPIRRQSSKRGSRPGRPPATDQARWGGKPACARCDSTRVWTIREGTTFECRLRPSDEPDLRHAAGEDQEAAKDAVRAVFEIRRGALHLGQGPAALTGFGSFKTAWSWLHKLRAAMVRPDREPLGPFVQTDETLVGGKGSPHKELVLVAAEADGRVRLAHADNNYEGTLKSFADGQIAADAQVVTDGLASYNSDSLGERPHQAATPEQTAAARERRPAGVSLDDVAPEALAARHACRRDEAQAPAGLSRRVRLPPQSPQDQRRWPDRCPRH